MFATAATLLLALALGALLLVGFSQDCLVTVQFLSIEES